MPYADPEDKLWQMKRWRAEHIKKGYGKWLYARRKLRFDNAERFRTALEHIIDASPEDRYGDSAALQMQQIARDAIYASQKAEQELGEFVPSD